MQKGKLHEFSPLHISDVIYGWPPKTSISETSVEAMADLSGFMAANSTQVFSDADITILQLYFSTFEYPTFRLTEESFGDFFGGTTIMYTELRPVSVEVGSRNCG